VNHEVLSPDRVINDLDQPMPEIPRTMSLIPSRTEMNTFIEMATAAAAAGLASSPQAAFVKMLFGRELGLSPLVAVAEIDLIPGPAGVKPALNSRTQIALIRRRELGDIRLVAMTDDGTTVEAWRADRPNEKHQFSFTMKDAEKAGLTRKDNYRKYGPAMYAARATSKAAKALFQETFLGLAYTADELGVETDEDGRALALPPPAETGIKRKTPPESFTEKEADAIAETVHDNLATSSESAPTLNVEVAPPTPPPPDTQLIEDIKLLITKLLKLSPAEWTSIRSRFFGAPGTEPSNAQRMQLRQYLSNLQLIRWLRTDELHIPNDKWQAVLQRRKVTQDIDLGVEEVQALADTLIEKTTPFNVSKLQHRLTILLRGNNATEPPSLAGNG